MQKTIYLSGSFHYKRHSELRKIRRQFWLAEQQLIEAGYKVINTFPLFINAGIAQRETIRQRLRLMMDADALYLLSDWNRSWAALVERSTAQSISMNVVYVEKNDRLICIASL